MKPERVAECSFTEFTDSGGVLHPSLLGFRTDKAASEVRREDAAPSTSTVPAGSRRARSPADPKPRGTTVEGVFITTPQRIVYRELGFTKLDLARFYAEIAEWILPHLAGRPLTLVRCDKGVGTADALRSECKFLRHQAGFHRWASLGVRRVQIQEQKKVGEYLVVASHEALLSVVQGDIVELHAWNSKAEAVEHPDRVVFDLDPAADVAWRDVLEAARLTRDYLASIGLQSWPKLTGGKGLHVVVPIVPELAWAEVYCLHASHR